VHQHALSIIYFWLLLGLFIAFFVQYRQLLCSNLQLEKTPDGREFFLMVLNTQDEISSHLRLNPN